ncbi:MAG TPA: DNA repair protein RecN [Acetobacteraceae bacterium]|nr:DNA repair protein RecN [Acetobacteraceae bacterium]
MLTSLSIREVVLIDRLDLAFGEGLTVLTGETGAGKSILLDALGLAMGARADQSLIRAGAEQAVVSVAFTVPGNHPAMPLLAEQGLDIGDEILIRRVITRDGRSRALVNDQPVGVGLLRRVSGLLIEIQGQHEQIGLADPASQLAMLDAYGVAPELREAAGAAHRAWKEAASRLEAAQAAIAEAAREEDFLRHAAAELTDLAPEPDEETHLAAERQRLQAGERHAEAIASALSELTPRERRNAGPGAALRAAARALGRISQADLSPALAAALGAIERAEEALAEAESLLARAAAEAEPEPRALEAAEERLFALRAMARKYAVSVAELPALRDQMSAKLAALDSGSADIAALAAEAAGRRSAFVEAAAALSAARDEAAAALMEAIGRELPPLKLDRARFFVKRELLPEAQWSARGADAVQFLVATNPGDAPGPLDKIASGGELSRLMLAMKVVLTGGSAVGTLIFDEVDSGIGGATAAAVGERLAHVASAMQVLVVTHSPQVAARGAAHFRVAKETDGNRAFTRVEKLNEAARREEIARMLAGETVTDAAREAARSLLDVP